MNPVLFKIGVFEVHTIFVAVLLFVLIFTLSFWSLSRKDLKNNPIFDIAVLTLIAALICSRLLGVLTNLEYYLSRGWSLFPFTEEGTTIQFFYKMPWMLLRLHDGNFVFIGVFLGMVIGLLFIYQNSNQKKTVYGLFDKLTLSYALASIFLLLGIYASGTSLGIQSDSAIAASVNGVQRLPLQILQIVEVAVFLILYVLLRVLKLKRDGLLTFCFMITYGIGEFIIRKYSEGYTAEFFSKFDYYQLIALAISLMGLFVGLVLLNIRIPFPKFSGRRKTDIEHRGSLARQSRRNVNLENPNRFVLSFSDRLKRTRDENLSEKAK